MNTNTQVITIEMNMDDRRTKVQRRKPMNSELEGIYVAAANRDDKHAIATLLQPLPGDIARNLRAGLATVTGAFSGMRHSRRTGRGYYVRANETAVQVLTLPRCSFKEAAAIWSVLDPVEPKVDLSTVMAAFNQITGRNTVLGH